MFDSDLGMHVSPQYFTSAHPTENVGIAKFLSPAVAALAGTGGATVDLDAYLECNYFFLDNEERQQFALNARETLVDRVQRVHDDGFTNVGTVSLDIGNPVKELVWVVRRNDAVRNFNAHTNYTRYMPAKTAGTHQAMISAKLMLNGMDRIEEKLADYYNKVQPFQHHTRIPRDGIYVYAFAVMPEKSQPSGTFNASMFNRIQLIIQVPTPTDPALELARPGYAFEYEINVFSLHTNLFRVMAGMGSMAYV